MKQPFKIIKYTPAWKQAYEAEKSSLIKILRDYVVSVHHIGSTAILHTRAKPEIDILVVVGDTSNLSSYDAGLEDLGYNVRGECLDSGGTPGRFYYSKDVNKIRTHKVHICGLGHSEIMDKLLFVKYLNEHSTSAKEYGDLKVGLSGLYNYGRGIDQYLEGKTQFVKEVLEKAKQEYDGVTYDDFCGG